MILMFHVLWYGVSIVDVWSLSKLSVYGVSGIEQTWFKNYLSGRSQYVHYDNVKSELQPAKTRVSQGSIFGPLIFLVQINCLTKKANGCSIQLYADDIVIYTTHRYITDIESTLSSNMDVIKDWLDKNRVIINLKMGRQKVCSLGLLSIFIPITIWR